MTNEQREQLIARTVARFTNQSLDIVANSQFAADSERKFISDALADGRDADEIDAALDTFSVVREQEIQAQIESIVRRLANTN